MARQRKKHHFWRNLLILIVLFGIYLYWGNRSIETDEATFTSGALPAGFDGCRIVQLSDLHGKYFGKDNERLYRAVKAAQPEYIFVTGDLVDRKTENPTVYAGEVGAALSAIAPTYYVTGNHEWGHGTKVVEEIMHRLFILVQQGGGVGAQLIVARGVFFRLQRNNIPLARISAHLGKRSITPDVRFVQRKAAVFKQNKRGFYARRISRREGAFVFGIFRGRFRGGAYFFHLHFGFRRHRRSRGERFHYLRFRLRRGRGRSTARTQ